MKPKNWKECPNCILKSFLWKLELEYDHYEGSMAETIHRILQGKDYANNELIIKNTWEQLTDEWFDNRCKQEIEDSKKNIECLEAYLKG